MDKPCEVPDKKKDKKKTKNPFADFKYVMRCEKKRNKALDPQAVQLLRGLEEDWNHYSQKLRYTASGKIEYNNPLDFDIDYFGFELPDDAYSGIVVGKRRTGKSVWTKDFVAKSKDRYDEIYVFTKTKINDWYQGWLHECYVYEGYQPETANQIFQRALQKEHAYRKGRSSKRARILVICDDLLSDAKYHKNDDTLVALYTLGRHVDISVLYLTQKFKGLPPIFRDNADIVVCFNMFNSNEAKQLAEEFLGGLNIRTAQEMLDLYCSQKFHTALIVETWRNCRDPEIFLKFYQAEGELKIPIGYLGSAEYNREAERQEAVQRGEQQNEVQIPSRESTGRGKIDVLDMMDAIF
jgi:hypothetical protein